MFFQLLKELAVLADVPKSKVSPHILRHAFATHLLNNDANRPVTVIMMLSAPLSVNLAGDLLISSAAKLTIVDLSWIIPLK